MKKPLEIETKYNGEAISLQNFKAYCEEAGPSSYKVVSGYDRFYSKKDDPESFCRHRFGAGFNQFTLKRKHSKTDNYIRTEHNIELGESVTQEQVEKLAAEFGYESNTQIYKTCFIYSYEYYIMVYYIIYDADLREKGRYLEIEAREDYDWVGEKEAWNAVVALEKLATKALGLSPQTRISKSLYEMFRK